MCSSIPAPSPPYDTSMSEKWELEQPVSRSSALNRAVRLTGVTLLSLAAVAHVSRPWLVDDLLPLPGDASLSGDARCPQTGSLVPPQNDELDDNLRRIYTDEFKNQSISQWAGLVRVKSESFDDNGDVTGDKRDPRWDVFYDVEQYLRQTFGLVHERLQLDKVNEHGLVYTWKGSDDSLKPGLFMAHQDTVPVNPKTVDDWPFPPWSGHYDGHSVWGRGASDCKNTLSGLLEAVTLLLEKNFTPRRTILLAFGFDEESKGWNGAGHIAPYLESIYGKDGIAFILDEGGLGIGEMYGAPFALPSTGEKGYVDISLSLKVPGGHSSVPPDHTSIGIISQIVNRLEANPFKPLITTRSPIFGLLECATEHGRLDSDLKRAVKTAKRRGSPGERARRQLAKLFASLGRVQKALVSTTQAVDVINGGVKVNALPETTVLTVNHRISVDSSSATVKEHYRQIVPPIARKYGLELDLFGHHVKAHRSHCSSKEDEEAETSGGKLVVEAINALEPAPISPTSGPQWEMLSGTIQHVYGRRFASSDDDSSSSKKDKPIVVSGSVMTGNTDTRFTWSLSRNIWRFTPIDRSAGTGVHTVGESLAVREHIDGVAFFHELIRNADVADF